MVPSEAGHLNEYNLGLSEVVMLSAAILADSMIVDRLVIAGQKRNAGTLEIKAYKQFWMGTHSTECCR